MSWKKFKVQVILVLDYKKRNNHKIFHSSIKLIANDWDIDEAFISLHQIIVTKLKAKVVKIELCLRCIYKIHY